ncbi:MAG: radical SAM protein [Nanoarchaeota archaeon]|nr:radical SAM protein [Nanoarchaeota archaeon]
MYLYAPPFSIVKEEDHRYKISDVLGGRFIFSQESISGTLPLIGRNTEELEKEELSLAKSLLEVGFLVETKFKRRDYFNYLKVRDRIDKGDGNIGDILTIGSVTFALINECPYSCEGCYAKTTTNDKRAPLFDEKRLEILMRDLSELGANNISISGGEPTFSKDTIRKTIILAEIASQAGIPSRLITTGYNLDTYAGELFDSPISHYQISLDGCADYNDKYKKFKGATERAVASIKRCIDAGVEYSVNSVITRKNLDSLIDFSSFLINLGVEELKVSRVMTYDDSLVLNAEDSKQLRKIIKELKEEYPKKINSFLDNQYIHENYIDCVAGKLYAHINCFGEVLPCAFYQTRSAGNIYSSKFFDIWSVNNTVLKEFQEGIVLKEDLTNCENRFDFFGNCRIEYEIWRSKCQNPC